jgi:tetratricopeptide (TPR) repeat protein
MLIVLSIGSSSFLWPQAVSPGIAQTAASPTTAELQRDLRNLEERQRIAIDGMEKTYRNGFWFLGFIVGVSTLMNIFRQFEERRILKYQELQLAEARELGKSYKANLDGTFALMGSVKNVIEYFKTGQEAADRIKKLEGAFTAETDQWEAQLAALNDRAVKLSPRCKRNSHNDPEIQRALRDFHDDSQIVARGRTTLALNANAHFLFGFHHRVEARYDEALDEFAICVQLLQEHRRENRSSLYNGMPAGTMLQTWLTKLENICWFHAGILRANLGQYDRARDAFEAALACDAWDYESLAYIPEVAFLGGLASFATVLSSFAAAIDKVNCVPPDQEKNFAKSKASLLAMLHLKFANCYMADSAHSDYRNHRDLSKAEYHIQAALACDPESLFARLALAQLYNLTGREPQKQQELFGAVFANARNVVTRVTEPKILMMYYYILLITSTLGDVPNESPAVYALRIYELVPRLPKPKELRIFSPRSKTDLRVEAFTSEVQAFEREFTKAARRSAQPVTVAAAAKTPERQPNDRPVVAPKTYTDPQPRPAVAAATYGTALLRTK